jgi:hypothetical protein
VLFLKFNPNVFEELCIKRETLTESYDFIFSDLADGGANPREEYDEG